MCCTELFIEEFDQAQLVTKGKTKNSTFPFHFPARRAEANENTLMYASMLPSPHLCQILGAKKDASSA